MKKILFCAFAIVSALLFSAFSSTEETSTAGEKWFVFVGSDASNAAQLNDPLNYELDGDGSMPTECDVTSLPYRCEIKIVPKTISGVERPDFSYQHIAQTTKPTIN